MADRELREQLYLRAQNLPLSAGVYIMHGRDGEVVYVGKSKKLRNRVSQYFGYGAKNVKTDRMVGAVRDFEVIFCESEMEALTLENKLIKQYTPRYNIRLKDCKSYPYIKVTTAEEYPRITVTRTRAGDKAKYFGPYSGMSTAYGIIDTVNKAMRLATCKHSFPRDIGKVRPCIYRQMNRCVAPCTGKVTKEEYREQIGGALHLLCGNIGEAKRELYKKMNEYASDERFEAAASCRDTIAALERLLEKQKVVESPEAEHDAVALASGGTCDCISIISIREGAVTGKEDFLFSSGEIASEGLASFLCDYYSDRYIPRELLVGFELPEDELDALRQIFSERAGHRVSVRRPQRGDALALCRLAGDNAEQRVKQYAADTVNDDETLVRLAKALALEVVPERIEAYDISNIGAEATTAGMIVCENGRFAKAKYRVFRIKTASRDDYAAMREALRRRLSHIGDDGFGEAPDLILLDGGASHVAVAKALFAEMKIDIPVFGMVKDDYHKTRALTAGDGDIGIARDTKLYSFIYKIQEEVHRFSLSKSQGAKQKTLKTSSLEKIDGIGKAKAEALLTHFGGLAAIKKASADELAKARGIGEKDAKAIRDYFDNKGTK